MNTDPPSANTAGREASEAPEHMPIRRAPVASTVWLTLVIGSVPLLWLICGPFPREAKGAGVLGLMLVLLVLGLPVGIALGITGTIGIFGIAGWSAALGALRNIPFSASASWSLSVIPMFVLMGLLLWRAGITQDLFRSVRGLTHPIPGGLAVTTNLAGAGLASVSGSTLGITYALARISIPEMLKSGYDIRLATGSVLMAGTGGQLIPPSILLVVYAGIAGVPVGPQLLAGFVPGLLLASIYTGLILTIATAFPSLAPRSSIARESVLKRLVGLLGIWPAILLVIVVIGGLYSGVFTATEAGAAGALVALILASWRMCGSNLATRAKAIGSTLAETARIVGSIFLLIIGAAFLNRAFILSGLPVWIASYIEELGLSRAALIVVLMVAYLVIGMFMEPLSMMLLTVPILMPTLAAADISLIWFGVFVVLLGEIAILTPPMGILSFVVHSICQDPQVNLGQRISLWSVFQGALWFIPASLLLVAILLLFPQIAEWPL